MAKKEATVDEIMSLTKSKVGHASHVPVLTCLSGLYKIETIVEIGSGPISTRLFLDRNCFRYVKSLISYEHREGWYKKVQSLIGEDKRLDYRLITSDVNMIDSDHTGDLLFLDGLKAHRKYGIERLGKNFKFVIQHDYKINHPYKHIWIYRPPQGPITSVASNTVDVNEVKWNCVWNKRLIAGLCKL